MGRLPHTEYTREQETMNQDRSSSRRTVLIQHTSPVRRATLIIPALRAVRPMSALLPMLALLGMMSCTVKYTYTKPDYETVEKQRLKKVVLVQTFEPSSGAGVQTSIETGGKASENTGPNPVANAEKKATLFALIAREFITHHHEYIVLRPRDNAALTDPAATCSADRRLDGMIISRFKQWNESDGCVRLEVQSTLYDCTSGARVWEALARHTYASEAPSLAVLIQAYSKRVGPEIRGSVAPVYLLVRKLFASLPDPALTSADVDAKIEADADW